MEGKKIIIEDREEKEFHEGERRKRERMEKGECF